MVIRRAKEGDDDRATDECETDRGELSGSPAWTHHDELIDDSPTVMSTVGLRRLSSSHSLALCSSISTQSCAPLLTSNNITLGTRLAA